MNVEDRVHFTKKELLDGMTGSAFLVHTRRLVVQAHRAGRPLTERHRAQIDLAVEVYGPEYFYMDGELFAE